MVGVPLLDPFAAIVVGAMIGRAGGQITVQRFPPLPFPPLPSCLSAAH